MLQLRELVYLWIKFIWRNSIKTPTQSLLLLLILSLGVAASLSIRMANRAAIQGFGSFAQKMSIQSQGIIRPLNKYYLNENDYLDSQAKLGSLPVHLLPILQQSALLKTNNNTEVSVSLVGIDLFVLQNIFSSDAVSENPLKSVDLKEHVNDVYLHPELAKSLTLAVDEKLHLNIGDRILTPSVAGLLTNEKNQLSLPKNWIILPLQTLQEKLQLQKQFSRIECVVPTGSFQVEVIKELETTLLNQNTQGWYFEKPGSDTSAIDKMTAAFQMNLNVLAMISVLVAIYLIAQALDANVVRRRQEISILRSLGIRRKVILELWLFDACIWGLIGGILGIFFRMGHFTILSRGHLSNGKRNVCDHQYTGCKNTTI